MHDKKQKNESMRLDTKEFELPETVYVRDIENRVFQGIIAKCLSNISGISLIEGGILDHILGREEGIAGIHTEQDSKQHAISVKIEVNIDFGISIPEKAEQIQTEVVTVLTELTGLHVAQVHVVFKQLSTTEATKKHQAQNAPSLPEVVERRVVSPPEYSDVF
jgi:uncharacterized alkaline shock family protein YloU